MDQPDGFIHLLVAAVKAMNIEPDDGDMRGGSGHIGKMIFSAGVDQVAIAAYVPCAMSDDVPCLEWLEAVLAGCGGELRGVVDGIGVGTVRAGGGEGGVRPEIAPMILGAQDFLRRKGLLTGESDEFLPSVLS